MRWDARLRSQSPISQSPPNPQRASRSSSSSGISSSRPIGRPYAFDSWSSQTYVLLAMRTARGIHASSSEKRSGSTSSSPKSGGSAAAPPPGPPWKRIQRARSSSAAMSIPMTSRSSSAPNRSPSAAARNAPQLARIQRSWPPRLFGSATAGARSIVTRSWLCGPNGVRVLAIDADHGMQDLVHEAERVELTRADRRVGHAVVAPSRRHLGGEAPHRAQVRQDDVPGQREERLVQAIAGAGLRRDVELAPAHGVNGMPYRRISLIAACVVGLPAAGVFFAGYQSRIVIRRWVTPTIPSSGGMSTRCDPYTSTSLSGTGVPLSKRMVTLRGRSLPP